MAKIKIHNPDKLSTCDFEELKELQDDFKVTTKDKLEKLKKVILARGFKYLFQVWVDDEGTKWIIDGHHRKRVLAMLRAEGHEVPKVPFVRIPAKDKKEAIEEIGFANSHYSEINPNTSLFEEWEIDEGLFEFGDMLDIEPKEGKENDIPGEIEFSDELMLEHNYVVLYFDNPMDWQVAIDRLGLKEVKSCIKTEKSQKVGIGRVVRGADVIKRIGS